MGGPKKKMDGQPSPRAPFRRDDETKKKKIALSLFLLVVFPDDNPPREAKET